MTANFQLLLASVFILTIASLTKNQQYSDLFIIASCLITIAFITLVSKKPRHLDNAILMTLTIILLFLHTPHYYQPLIYASIATTIFLLTLRTYYQSKKTN